MKNCEVCRKVEKYYVLGLCSKQARDKVYRMCKESKEEKMDKELEKKLASYLYRTMDYKEYQKLAEWMDDDRAKFNKWVAKNGFKNV